MLDQNLDLKEKLASVIDRATQEAIALLLTQREVETPSVESAPEWMTAAQLARYWQRLCTKMRWSVQYRERSDRMLDSTSRCDSHNWQPVN